MYLGEASGVAVNSKRHIFVFSRGNTTGPAYGAAAAQLLEFAPDGRFMREIGHNLYAWSFAHAVRIDKEDNIWVIDKGSDMVIKFDPEGRVMMVFGRKQEASDEGPEPLKASAKPPLPADRRPVPPGDGRDVGPAGQHLHQRRLHQFARGQGGQERRLGEAVRRRRERAGAVQHAAQHRRRTPRDNIYVADRGNRRIQVFDADGKFLRQIKIDVPFDYATVHGGRSAIQPPRGTRMGRMQPGAPWAICITPGPHQVLYSLGCVFRGAFTN